MPDLDQVKAVWWEMGEKERALWLEIGERLVVGMKRYGGFKFAEYDLDQMAKEEIADFLVYISAKYMKREK